VTFPKALPVPESTPAEEVVEWAYATYDRVALVASFQAESIVLIDMASRVTRSFDVITLDTGRLPEATHEVIDQVRDRYPGMRLHVQTPDSAGLARFIATNGVNPFYRSVELRLACCAIRKTAPLTKALGPFDAWITGLRRDQGRTRLATGQVAADPMHGGITKIAPLATWTAAAVWDHIRTNELPYNRLYDAGFTSIGCAPCTRAVEPGEPERAGRWWWEGEAPKECGLHWSGEAS
jgi:phosphoadenylyl-sulfate reductase (thioredoxin)